MGGHAKSGKEEMGIHLGGTPRENRLGAATSRTPTLYGAEESSETLA